MTGLVCRISLNCICLMDWLCKFRFPKYHEREKSKKSKSGAPYIRALKLQESEKGQMGSM